MARDVLDYLDSGDPRYRERFEDNSADFERFTDRYDELVDTERGKKQGERIEVLYEEYVTLGEDLTGADPSGRSGRGHLIRGEAVPGSPGRVGRRPRRRGAAVDRDTARGR